MLLYFTYSFFKNNLSLWSSLKNHIKIDAKRIDNKNFYGGHFLSGMINCTFSDNSIMEFDTLSACTKATSEIRKTLMFLC